MAPSVLVTEAAQEAQLECEFETVIEWEEPVVVEVQSLSFTPGKWKWKYGEISDGFHTIGMGNNIDGLVTPGPIKSIDPHFLWLPTSSSRRLMNTTRESVVQIGVRSRR